MSKGVEESSTFVGSGDAKLICQCGGTVYTFALEANGCNGLAGSSPVTGTKQEVATVLPSLIGSAWSDARKAYFIGDRQEFYAVMGELVDPQP